MSLDLHIIRGRLLSFLGEPMGPDEQDKFTYVEDGALVCENGKIAWRGPWESLPEKFKGLDFTDHRPHLIVPGFIDCHIHFPQLQVVGSYAGSLLEWLNTYTFVEEQRYSDADLAAAMASRFLDQLVEHGTTTAVAFGSVHKVSCDALLGEAEKRNMRMIAGKVMMDRNAPEALLDTPQTGYDDTKALLDTWTGRGRCEVAITPRFALTSSEEQMEISGALVREFPDAIMQTHLSENHDEIAAVMALYPRCKDYTDVYEQYGLLTDKALFGHTIHVSERETARLAESGAVAVFCPTSNLFLGSGSYDHARLSAAGVRHAIATDIGGGTSWSMLRTLDEGYKIQNCLGNRYHPLRSFYQATLGNARAINRESEVGTLEIGTEADFIVLNVHATSAMALRAERIETLSEELFVLQTMGDDRAVEATYIAGNKVK
ncbi:guanine deaminase [Ahrensia kielensis]|uniref:guanine deaminase n=1 Tax=Ahrensia kielensis TaxID=76980 RepID=UPI0004779121